jgi:hypothetical protein
VDAASSGMFAASPGIELGKSRANTIVRRGDDP